MCRGLPPSPLVAPRKGKGMAGAQGPAAGGRARIWVQFPGSFLSLGAGFSAASAGGWLLCPGTHTSLFEVKQKFLPPAPGRLKDFVFLQHLPL